MATLSELTAFLKARLALPASTAAENEVPLLWRPSQTSENRPLRCIVLALEWLTKVPDCDVLFLHRPFNFPPDALPGVPVLASHTGFDTHLTTGYSPALAAALGMKEITPLFRPDRPDEVIPVGMIGDLEPPTLLGVFAKSVGREFQGMDTALVWNPDVLVWRAAVLNALNPALVTMISDLGATVCVTGQMRENARNIAAEKGVSLLAAGHTRIEWWGLRRLAAEIEKAFPDIKTNLLQA